MKSNEIILTIVTILILAGTIATIFYFATKDETKIERTSFNIKTFNEKGQILNSTICIYEKDFNIKCSNFTGTWEQFYLKKGINHTILAKSNNYYNYYKVHEINGANLEAKLIPFGEVNISQEGELKDNKVNLIIKTTGLLRKPNLCFKSSLGINKIKMERQKIECDKWINISDKYFKCENSNEIYSCEELEGKTCLLSEQIPTRFEYIDNCYQIGRDFQDEEVTVRISFETFLLLEGDYIDVFLFDEDYILKGENFMTYYELEEKDVGMPDIRFTIK